MRPNNETIVCFGHTTKFSSEDVKQRNARAQLEERRQILTSYKISIQTGIKTETDADVRRREVNGIMGIPRWLTFLESPHSFKANQVLQLQCEAFNSCYKM